MVFCPRSFVHCPLHFFAGAREHGTGQRTKDKKTASIRLTKVTDMRVAKSRKKAPVPPKTASQTVPEDVFVAPFEGESASPPWEEIEAGRYQPRRIRGSCRGRALG